MDWDLTELNAIRPWSRVGNTLMENNNAAAADDDKNNWNNHQPKLLKKINHAKIISSIRNNGSPLIDESSRRRSLSCSNNNNSNNNNNNNNNLDFGCPKNLLDRTTYKQLNIRLIKPEFGSSKREEFNTQYTRYRHDGAPFDDRNQSHDSHNDNNNNNDNDNYRSHDQLRLPQVHQVHQYKKKKKNNHSYHSHNKRQRKKQNRRATKMKSTRPGAFSFFEAKQRDQIPLPLLTNELNLLNKSQQLQQPQQPQQQQQQQQQPQQRRFLTSSLILPNQEDPYYDNVSPGERQQIQTRIQNRVIMRVATPPEFNSNNNHIRRDDDDVLITQSCMKHDYQKTPNEKQRRQKIKRVARHRKMTKLAKRVITDAILGNVLMENDLKYRKERSRILSKMQHRLERRVKKRKSKQISVTVDTSNTKYRDYQISVSRSRDRVRTRELRGAMKYSPGSSFSTM